MIIDPYTWTRLPISSLTRITPSVLSVRVPKPNHFSFQPGQYVIMKVSIDGAPLLRQYSIASGPRSDELEFLIQREENGTVTNWFHDKAEAGTNIEISQAFGHFVLDDSDAPIVLVAGRVGVAPFLSMIRDRQDPTEQSQLKLLYSCRGNDDFCYREELESYGAELFDTDRAERIDIEKLHATITPTTRYFLCGSKQFADSLAASLYQLGVPIDRIRRELFTLQ